MENVLNYDDIAPMIGMLQLNNLNLTKMLVTKEAEIMRLNEQLAEKNGHVDEPYVTPIVRKVKDRPRA